MHIHIIEPVVEGHHMQYVRRVIEQAPQNTIITLSIFSDFDENNAGFLEVIKIGGTRLRIKKIAIPPYYKIVNNAKRGIILQPIYWLLFRRHWNSLMEYERGDLLIIPYLDYCSYSIGLFGSPFGKSIFWGIVMRPEFHWSEQGVVAPRKKLNWLTRILFLRLLQNKSLFKLTTIDPSLMDWAIKNKPIGYQKIKYSDDHSDLKGIGDRNFARRHFGIPVDSFVVLLFGSIDIRKGISDLLNLVSSSDWPINGVGLIIGKQTENAKIVIEKHAKSLPTGRLVCVDRYVDRQEEWLAFQASDCGWLAYCGFYGPSGFLSQCIDAGIDVIHRREGLCAYHAKKIGTKLPLSKYLKDRYESQYELTTFDKGKSEKPHGLFK